MPQNEVSGVSGMKVLLSGSRVEEVKDRSSRVVGVFEVCISYTELNRLVS